MVTIAGLGNPGKEYENSRHNIGWVVLSAIVTRYQLPSFTKSARYNGLLSEGVLHGAEVGVLFPTTYMNNSGIAVERYVLTHGALDSLVVVHDDIDIPFGEIRVSFDRGAGGNNGVSSIIDAFHSKRFARIRVGIAKKNIFGTIKRPKGEALSKFVLGTLTAHEQRHIEDLVDKVDHALEVFIKKGIMNAMQECNKE